MARYIDAVKTADIISEKLNIPLGDLVDIFAEIPTADVVEVVRCKDCVNGRKTNKIMSPEKYYKTDCVVCECEDVIGDEPMIYVPTHFCSYGERRTDNDV